MKGKKNMKHGNTKNLNLQKEEYARENDTSLEVCVQKKAIKTHDWTSREYPEDVQKIRDFDFNPENAYNCDNCPHNNGVDSWQGKYPCGQWNCWVVCSCT
jgi:hypothetical protein